MGELPLQLILPGVLGRQCQLDYGTGPPCAAPTEQPAIVARAARVFCFQGVIAWGGLFPAIGVAFLLAALWLPRRRFTGAAESRLPAPPEAEKIPVTDNYFGTKVVDNYRWLEDANSPETKAFIDAGECVHRALHEAGAHPPADCRRSGRAGARIALDRAHAARKRSVLREAVGGRRAGIDLRAPRMGGEGQAADRSGAVQPRSQHVSRSGGRIARRNAGGVSGSRRRRGRNHGARIQREDRQDARG